METFSRVSNFSTFHSVSSLIPVVTIVTKLLPHCSVCSVPSVVSRELNHDLTSHICLLYLQLVWRKASDRKNPPIWSYKHAQTDTPSGTALIWLVYSIVKLKLSLRDDLRLKNKSHHWLSTALYSCYTYNIIIYGPSIFTCTSSLLRNPVDAPLMVVCPPTETVWLI